MVLHAQHERDGGLGMLVSTPLRDGTGAWSVLLGRRINERDGRFAGTVVAALNLAYFTEFHRSVEPSENGVIILHRADGVVLASYPSDGADIGTSYAELPPFKTVLAAEVAGSVMMDGPRDGGRRLVAVRALKLFPLAVSVSASIDSVLAPWRQQAGAILLAGLAAAGTIGALLLMLAGESRRVELLLVESAAARDAAEQANLRLTEQMEERERTELALRQAQRLEAVGQLTGGVAHDFNNLLTVLLGNIDLMQALAPGEATADPAQHARLERMRIATERGAKLTDQLLAFARRQPLLPRVASLNSVVGGMTDLVQSAAGGNVRLVKQLQQDLWPALVDIAQIELVILNLAINARDAMPKGGTLTIETANITLIPLEATEDLPAGDYVVVRVGDTGVGMTPEVIAKAFEPFFTTKGLGVSSGLGLSQVYGLARQSGGGVRIDSAAGRGTSVSVFLPRAGEGAECSEAGARLMAPMITRGAQVLIVDDDEAVRLTTASILESLGYVIATVESGVAALERIAAGAEVDLLLTDVAMPGMNGAELADRVRERWPSLPIVFFSGYADPDAIAGRQILQRMVRKPFRAIDMAAQIEAALADRELYQPP